MSNKNSLRAGNWEEKKRNKDFDKVMFENFYNMTWYEINWNMALNQKLFFCNTINFFQPFQQEMWEKKN